MDTGNDNPLTNEPARFTDAVAGMTIPGPGSLIAALPAMLGFVPSRSVVLAFDDVDRHDGRRPIRLVIRFDVDAVIEAASGQHIVSEVDAIWMQEGVITALAVIVDERPDALATATAALKLLQRSMIEVTGAWLVPEITAHARYRGLLDSDGTGTVKDPSASPFTAARVFSGATIRASREDVVELLAPDPVMIARVEPHIGPAVAQFHIGIARAVTDQHGNTHRRSVAESILALLADSETDYGPTDLAAAIAGIRDQEIRDIMLGLAGTSLGQPAQQLWHQLARASTCQDRAVAAMLCGHDAYHRGDGVYAAICFAAALEAQPGYPLAVMLDTALSGGLRPREIGGVAEFGRGVAAAHGIDLPPAD